MLFVSIEYVYFESFFFFLGVKNREEVGVIVYFLRGDFVEKFRCYRVFCVSFYYYRKCCYLREDGGCILCF